MISTFEVITGEFIDDMEAIRSLVVTFDDPHKTAKVRIAAANSATLLVAATFEEFVREMAREFARMVVSNAVTFERLPPKLAATAWKRTMEGLSKIKFDGCRTGTGTEHAAAHARFITIFEFCKGDLSQDIYQELIHNENNMRPNEINSLFKLSGLSNVCMQLSDKKPILEAFGETEPGKAHGKLLNALEDFFDRRNAIAHALNPGQSIGPNQIMNDLDMLQSLGKALHKTLDDLITRSTVTPPNNFVIAVEPPESHSWWQRLYRRLFS